MIRLVTGRRRLLRKRMYKAPHERNRTGNTFVRENKNLAKPFQDDYRNKEIVVPKRRPKREAVSGFKMSYRYKYYNQEKPEEEDEEEL